MSYDKMKRAFRALAVYVLGRDLNESMGWKFRLAWLIAFR